MWVKRLPITILARIVSYVSYEDYVNIEGIWNLKLNKNFQKYLKNEKYGLIEIKLTIEEIEENLRVPEADYRHFKKKIKEYIRDEKKLDDSRIRILNEYKVRWPKLEYAFKRYFKYGIIEDDLIVTNYFLPKNYQLTYDEINSDRIIRIVANKDIKTIYQYLISTPKFDFNYWRNSYHKIIDRIMIEPIITIKYLMTPVKYNRFQIYCYILDKYYLDHLLCLILFIIIALFLNIIVKY